MILDSEKAESRLKSESNLANKIAEFRNGRKVPEVLITPNGSVSTITTGSSKKLPRVPSDVREAIGLAAMTGLETQEEIAKRFGTSQPQVSQCKIALEKKSAEKSDPIPKIKDIAVEKLMVAMGLLTEDKLSSCKAKDLATISGEMARVIDRVTPKVAQVPLVNLVVYAPQIRSEESYKVVEISPS